MTPAALIAAIREAMEKAGSGPWEVDHQPSEDRWWRVKGPYGTVCAVDGKKFTYAKETAAFIALSRQAVPVLLAEIDGLYRELEISKMRELEMLEAKHEQVSKRRPS